MCSGCNTLEYQIKSKRRVYLQSSIRFCNYTKFIDIFAFKKNAFEFYNEITMKFPQFSQHLYTFYRDGFRNMTVGKTLWLLVLIKLFIMFAILRIFFFPNYLNSHFSDEKSKANHVRHELIEKSHK